MSTKHKSELASAPKKTSIRPDLIVTQSVRGDAPETLIFPIWSDEELNNEAWTPVATSKDTSSFSNGHYTDHHIIKLPSELSEVTEWLRPHKLYEDFDIVLYKKETISYGNLLSCNNHILLSGFICSFISAIKILDSASYVQQWTMESTNVQFTPPVYNENWKPWHHIYSLCKAGKDQEHNPQYNAASKYAVRLHWMGCWRKILVDDKIPVDSRNFPLLPLILHFTEHKPVEQTDETQKRASKASKINQFSKEEILDTVQLWPLILIKALLKLASLYCTNSNHLCDFDIISALTGWVVKKIDTHSLSVDDVWEMCRAYSDHYVWPEMKDENEHKTSYHEHFKNKSGKSDKKSGSLSPSSNKTKTGSLPDIQQLGCVLVATYHPYKRDSASIEEDICYHQFLITQTRNIPFEKPIESAELPRWKLFRWVEWAIEHGLYKKGEDYSTFKFLKIYSAFRSCIEPIIKSRPQSADLQKSKILGKRSIISVKSIKNEATSTQEQTHIWCDFNEINKYISALHIYLKPSKFVSNHAITSMNWHEESIKQTQQENTTFVVHKEVLKYGNCPAYIFLNSLEAKFMAIQLSQTGNQRQLIENIESSEYLEKSVAHLVLENYTWQSNKINDKGISLNTYCSKALIWNLKPGRIIIRLWITSDNPFYIKFLSDTELHVGSFEAILHQMQNKSYLLSSRCNQISSRFGELINALGTQDYQIALRNFYASYKPSTELSKTQYEIIHNEFMKELLAILSTIYKNRYFDMEYALKVLFLTPKFLYNPTPLTKIKFEADNVHLDFDAEDMKCLERGVSYLQAYVRRRQVQKLKSLQNHSNNHFKMIVTSLRQIYQDVFSVGTHEVHSSKLLRNLFFFNTNFQNFKRYYFEYQDLQSVVHLTNILEIATVPENNWFPIIKCTFFIQSNEGEILRINLFTTTPRYVLRIYDNDTFEQIEGIIDIPAVRLYKPNKKGYTIFGYGWNLSSTRTVHSKLCIVSLKKQEECMVHIPKKQFKVEATCENFKSHDGELFKYNLTTNKECYASYRLTSTCPTANLHLRCIHSDRTIIGQVMGEGSTILSLLHLTPTTHTTDIPPNISSSGNLNDIQQHAKIKKSKRKSSSESNSLRKVSSKASTFEIYGNYTLEAYVLNNSWKLTPDEFQVIKEVKKRNNLISTSDIQATMESGAKIKFSGSSRRSIHMKHSIDFSNIQKPYWCLQAVYDHEDSPYVTKDKRRDNEIRGTKLQWYQTDPARYKKGQELREAFINPPKVSTDNVLSTSDVWIQNLKASKTSSPLTLNKIKDCMFGALRQNESLSNVLHDKAEEIDSLDKEFTVRTEELKLASELQIQNEIQEFQDMWRYYSEDMKNLLNESISKNIALTNWYDGLRDISMKMMDQAKRVREQCVEALRPEKDVSNGIGKKKINGKPDKKDKKKKK